MAPPSGGDVAVVTGSGGLVGGAMVELCHEEGMRVEGIDNDARAYFFGPDASTAGNTKELERTLDRFRSHDLDIRDREGVMGLFQDLGRSVSLVVHAAAQPSHDWAAKEPFTDFDINAVGTLNLLEAVRQHAPDAVFVFVSTNKVYGDRPNDLPLVETETRWTVEEGHPYAEHGIDETMSVDACLHSLFGASKLAADVMVQEYGRYFGMNTGVFRGGCLTGPTHAGAELHGFLAYLVKCVVTGTPYTIFGHKGKQVRDNIHSDDLVRAFWTFARDPKPGAVYNIGGGPTSNISMLEAIRKLEELTGRNLDYSLSDDARAGDHIWYVSDLRRFRTDYRSWELSRTMDGILEEMVERTTATHGAGLA